MKITTELKHILLVDDSPNDVELTLIALAENNMTNKVDIVTDGAQALDYLYRREQFADRENSHPAVVLLDLKLPKVDGLQVLEQVKSDPQLKMIPIVMLTSSREEQDLLRSYNLGVNAYVVKPVGFVEFVKALKEVGLFWAVINQPPPVEENLAE